jgi:glucose/arabinose dehydrogenase
MRMMAWIADAGVEGWQRGMMIPVLMLIKLGVAFRSSSPTVTEAASNTAGLALPPGFVAEKLPGSENEEAGQIVRIDLADGSQTILAEQLDKPTGVAILDDTLWIATRDAILRRQAIGTRSGNIDHLCPGYRIHSTPASVAISPFASDTLLVALWVAGEVVQVPITYVDDNAAGDPEPFLSGVDQPQHLLVAPNGSLWVSDYAGGHIYRVWRP